MGDVNTALTATDRVCVIRRDTADGPGQVGSVTPGQLFEELGVSYDVGAGDAVTQTTGRTSGVTINKNCGSITLVSAAGSTTPATFTVTNSKVAATDVIVLNQKSGTDKYHTKIVAVRDGSFDIQFNTVSGTTTEQPVFNFVILKAVAN
jgi:hypothetical protein